MEKQEKNIKEIIDYLRNLKLTLVNGHMVKDTEIKDKVIDQNIDKKETLKKGKKDFYTALNDVCNLKFEIENGKVKKITKYSFKIKR